MLKFFFKCHVITKYKKSRLLTACFLLKKKLAITCEKHCGSLGLPLPPWIGLRAPPKHNQNLNCVLGPNQNINCISGLKQILQIWCIPSKSTCSQGLLYYQNATKKLLNNKTSLIMKGCGSVHHSMLDPLKTTCPTCSQG